MPAPNGVATLGAKLRPEAWARRSQMSQQRGVRVGQGAVRVSEGRSERRSVIAAGALAGIVGPILFTVTFFVQGLFRLEEYDPVAEVVSALEAGPGGWVQQVNFVVFGLLTIVFAVGLHLGLRQTRLGAIGPSLLVLSGMALVWAAVFPLREDAAGVTYDPGLHIVGGMTFFLSSALGLIVVSRRLAADPSFRQLGGYALGAGITGVALFVLMGAFVVPDDAPLHAWAGLAQRIVIVVVLFPCTVVIALRLLRVTRADDAPL
jgi:hypothetical membrane protein